MPVGLGGVHLTTPTAVFYAQHWAAAFLSAAQIWLLTPIRSPTRGPLLLPGLGYDRIRATCPLPQLNVSLSFPGKSILLQAK